MPRGEFLILLGVFVNEDPKNIIELLEEDILDVAQLHGDETEEDIQYLQAATQGQSFRKVEIFHMAVCGSQPSYSGAGSGQHFAG